jgi:hypothetical protein
MPSIDPWPADLTRRVPGFLSLKDAFAQGCVRKETFLYRT